MEPPPKPELMSSTARRLSILKSTRQADQSVPPVLKAKRGGGLQKSGDRCGGNTVSSTASACVGGIGPVGGNGLTGSNMRKLLDDLHQSRMCIEQDQKAYQKARRDIEEVDEKLLQLRNKHKKGDEKWKELSETAGIKKTELNSLEIKNKIVEKTIKNVEQELAIVMEELHRVRMESFQLSSSYLSESVEFAMVWNGTEFGHHNRMQYQQNERDNLERQKRQLEFELADFLVLQKGMEECEKEIDEIEHQFQEHDEAVSKQEKELQDKIDALDLQLKDLEHQEEEYIRSAEEECEKLKREIKETKDFLALVESKKAESNSLEMTSETTNLEDQTEQDEGNTSATSNSVNNEASNYSAPTSTIEAKNRSARFQVPLKTQLSFSNNPNLTNSILKRNVSSETGENLSNSNDEDFLVAAAAEVSQNMRTYEPVTPSTYYTQRHPPPAKLRVVERQVPITSFMRQMSSTMKRPSKSSAASQGKSSSARASISSGKVFHFKKKVCTSLGDKENITANCDSFNSNSSTSFSTSLLQGDSDESICPEVKNNFDSSEGLSGNSSSKFPPVYADKPFSCFSSSRLLLSESQQEQLLCGSKFDDEIFNDDFVA